MPARLDFVRCAKANSPRHCEESRLWRDDAAIQEPRLLRRFASRNDAVDSTKRGPASFDFGSLGIGLIMVLLVGAGSVYAAVEKKDPQAAAVEQRQRAEIMTYFLGDSDKAVFPKSPMAIELYNQAVGYVQKNEFELARKALQESIRQDGTSPFAYELMGDIESREQRLSEAKANYEIAYNLMPREELKKKIETTVSEVTVDKKLSTYREEHFLIKYYDKDQSMDGFELREILRTSYEMLSRDFAFYFRHKVVVLLYDEEDFRKITGVPHWVAGIYDGKVRMPIRKGSFRELDLRALTVHELTHAFVVGMSSGKAPPWINEGLAEVEANKIKPVDMLVFNSAVKTNTLMSLDELMASQTVMELKDPLLVALFYSQSFHLMSYLIDRYKMFFVKKILEEYGKGKNSDEAIRAVLKISPVRLESEWKDTFLKPSK